MSLHTECTMGWSGSGWGGDWKRHNVETCVDTVFVFSVFYTVYLNVFICSGQDVTTILHLVHNLIHEEEEEDETPSRQYVEPR